MTNWQVALPLTLLLLALSAFFVMIEFALLGTQRHRLEENVKTSASSRAALRSLNDLTLMLAGAQLGITLCTFALGAITKPWVQYSLRPVFDSLHVPAAVAETFSFIIALFMVTFLHLVVGEMAPKSWAITHPDRAVRLIAIPARAFVMLFRPLLLWFNRIANALVRASGQTPVNRAAAKGYDAKTLALLVKDSHESGSLQEGQAQQLSELLDFDLRTAGEVVSDPGNQLPLLPLDSSVAQVQQAVVGSGQLRVLLDAGQGRYPLVVHVRDTLQSEAEDSAQDFARDLLALDASLTLLQALKRMRAQKEQVVAVQAAGSYLGILSWDFLLQKLWANRGDSR